MSKSPRPRQHLMAGVVVLAFIGLAGTGFTIQLGRASAPATAAPPSIIPITAVHAMMRDLPIIRSGLGSVTPLNQVDVKMRVDGQIKNIAFKEGQEVTAGDLLGQIDSRPFQAQLGQAEAMLQKDTAQLGNARSDESRATRLSATGAGTMQASDNAKAQVAINQALVAGDQAAVDTAKLNLSFTAITAPISGRVGFKQVNEGAIVHASDSTGFVTITQIHPIAVQLSLPQDDLPELLAGQTKAPLQVSIDSRDGSRHLADGQVTVIDSAVDGSTGTIKLKAQFANDDRALWPGALVTARVLVSTDRNAVVLPSIAIQNGQRGPYVFLVKPDNTVTIVQVKTGAVVGDQTSVTSGISAGDNVVLSGHSRLAAGTRVAVTQGDSAAKVAQETLP